MASYLKANPDDAAFVAHHRRTGQMVPIARDGALLALVNRRHLDAAPITVPLPVQDYVVGLELLGFSFLLWAPFEGVQKASRIEPDDPLPPGWDRQAMRIMTAFGEGRWEEVATFLRQREAGQ